MVVIPLKCDLGEVLGELGLEYVQVDCVNVRDSGSGERVVVGLMICLDCHSLMQPMEPFESQTQVRVIDASNEIMVVDGTQVYDDSENSHAVANVIAPQHENGVVQVVVQVPHDGIARLKQSHACVS